MKSGNTTYRLGDENGVITIPIVVHIIHRPGESISTGSNLSEAQIQSQIDVLNEDYSRTNPDRFDTRPEWQGIAQNPQFQFQLACVDPNGFNTNGITRKASPSINTLYNADTDDAKSNATGGQNPWPTDRYLNVWVVTTLTDNFGSSPYGYAQFPNLYSTNPTTDGIVIIASVFGRGFPNLEFNNNKGRILTHEVGHWLNVFHVFEGGCSDADQCADTPPQREPSRVCNFFPQVTCNNEPYGNMVQNYMNYTHDNCMNLFTQDQVLRMRAIFQPSGARRSFIDNYFNIFAIQTVFNCDDGGPIYVRTPFCIWGQTTWSHTGPIIPDWPANGAESPIYSVIGDGEATITTTWGNYTDTETFTVGRGVNKGVFFDPTYGLYQTLLSGDSRDVPVSKTLTLDIENAAASSTPTVTINNTPPNFLWSQYGNTIRFRFSRTNGSSYRTVTFNVTTNTNCGALTSNYTFNNYNSGFYFRISPNPASDYLIVKSLNVDTEEDNNTNESNKKPPKFDVNIYDNINRLVKQVKNLEGFEEKQIDISGLPNTQHYNIQIVSEQNVSVHKIFKH